MATPLLSQKRTEQGYVLVYLPAHPDAQGGYVFLHRLVMEAALGGRVPRGCEVHHKDRDPSNNALENLQLLPTSLHEGLHNVRDERSPQAALECDTWAKNAFEELRAHYERARDNPPEQWASRVRPAELAKRAQLARDIEVLKGKWDWRLRQGKNTMRSPEELAAEIGCTLEVVRRQMLSLAGVLPVVRKSKRGPGAPPSTR